MTAKQMCHPFKVAIEGPSEWPAGCDDKGERDHLPAAENGWYKGHRRYHLSLQDLKQRERSNSSVGVPPRGTRLCSPRLSRSPGHCALPVDLSPWKTMSSTGGRGCVRKPRPGIEQAQRWLKKRPASCDHDGNTSQNLTRDPPCGRTTSRHLETSLFREIWPELCLGRISHGIYLLLYLPNRGEFFYYFH